VQRYCNHCGRMLIEGFAYCDGCGVKIGYESLVTMTKEDVPAKYAQSLMSILITTAGLMLTLSWGLLQLQVVRLVVPAIQLGSLFLFLSIFASILSHQFLVSQANKRFASVPKDKERKSVAMERDVGLSFLAAWMTFIVGACLVLIAIWTLN